MVIRVLMRANQSPHGNWVARPIRTASWSGRFGCTRPAPASGQRAQEVVVWLFLAVRWRLAPAMSDWEEDGEEDGPPTHLPKWRPAAARPQACGNPTERGGRKWGSRPAPAQESWRSGPLEYRPRRSRRGAEDRERPGSPPLSFHLDNALVGTLIGSAAFTARRQAHTRFLAGGGWQLPAGLGAVFHIFVCLGLARIWALWTGFLSSTLA